jgi:hypothetical protein
MGRGWRRCWISTYGYDGEGLIWPSEILETMPSADVEIRVGQKRKIRKKETQYL